MNSNLYSQPQLFFLHKHCSGTEIKSWLKGDNEFQSWLSGDNEMQRWLKGDNKMQTCIKGDK